MRAPSLTALDFNSRSASARRGSAVGASLLLLLLAGLFAVTSAEAALVHSFDSYTGGGLLSTPESLAVDQATGDLYVLEHGSGCVSRFYGERGGPEALEPHVFPATGTNKVCGLQLRETPSNAGLAVDNSGTSTQGTFYVNSPLRNGGIGATLGFDPEGNLVSELAPHSEEIICGVATDPSGNVYVAQRYAGVWKYKHDDPVTDADVESGLYEGPACLIARDSVGNRYDSWEPNGPAIKSGSLFRESSYGIGLDPSTDDFYVSEGGDVSGVDSAGVQFDQFGAGHVTEARGVALDPATGIAYVSDTPNGRIALFQGVPTYRLEADFAGTGLGAVSADHPPLEACGDEGACVGYYVASKVELKATPQPHSIVSGWTGCDQVSPEGDKCTVDIANTDRDVLVHFTRLQNTVTATTAGTGSGSVSASGGAVNDCGGGGACSGLYDEGSAIELVATPTGHSSFVGWSGACVNASGPCELPVEGNPSVTAHFTAQHAISVKKGGGGGGSVLSEPNGLNCGGVCVGYFTDGQLVTLTAVPSGHSSFAGWSGSGCSGTDICQVAIGDSTKDVVAVFTHDPPAVLTEAATTFLGQHVATVHGMVNPNGAEVSACAVEYGTNLTYGSTAPCAPTALGAGVSLVPFGVDLAGLSSGTTYHFRFAVTTIGGTTRGDDQTFRTLDDTCDTNEALCTPISSLRTEPKKCRAGFVRKKGRCVKSRHKRHGRSRGATR